MFRRPEPLPTLPDRAPYFAISLPDDLSLTLRAPSAPKMAELVKSIGPERQGKLIGMLRMVETGKSIVAILLAADDVLPLFAGLLGLCWVDPVWQLESAPREAGEDLGVYGLRIYEELHEAGWSLQTIALSALAILDRVRAESEIDREAAERAAFFPLPKARSSESAQPSRHTTSGDGEGEPSPN